MIISSEKSGKQRVLGSLAFTGQSEEVPSTLDFSKENAIAARNQDLPTPLVLLNEMAIQKRALHRSHCLKLSGSLVWCKLCGAYADQRVKAFKKPCRGPEKVRSKAGQLVRLRQGRHPTTGEALDDPASLPASRGSSSRMTSMASRSRSSVSSPVMPSSSRGRTSTNLGAAKALCLALSKPVLRLVGHAVGKLAC